MPTDYDHRSAAEQVAKIAAQHAVDVDEGARFPGATVKAAREAGLLGLLSAEEVGGRGFAHREAAEVIERIARECGSSAMVLTMHYAGTSVIEAYGPRAVREAIARGEHLSTLAFSEAGSRSHFWAPLGTATPAGEEVVLEARKSWVTSAEHADSYVWSSRPAAGSEASSLWLVPRDATGLVVKGGFDGLGLRGNDSCPVEASGVRIPASHRLGEDGGGFGVMMQTVLPLFSVLVSAGSIGLMEAAVAATCDHAGGMRYAHLDSKLADLPTIRAYVARMRIELDKTRALWLDTISALEAGREDAMLRVLECKAASGEAAVSVLDTAMRVCGGLAFRKDVGVERRFRDARASMVMAPTSDQLFDFIGRAICGMELFD
ncbi:MAG TPA: acyl-CoA dehydrogenase family protein [Myxococcota bacterium]|nr:acyl-CoA dehydrogenase family protein [Myxococcota bacterium]